MPYVIALASPLLISPHTDGKEITLESPFGDELPSKGFDAGVDTYQSPPADLSERTKLNVKVDPASNRLQLLEPFKPIGTIIKNAAILIKVRSHLCKHAVQLYLCNRLQLLEPF